jgi:flagellar motor switch protein FliM
MAGNAGESEAEADLALDWGDAARPAAGAAGADPEPLVGPAELDQLLGAQGGRHRPGILSVVESGGVTYERLPMLEVVFDRLQRLLTSSLRGLTSANPEVRLEEITAQRLGDYLAALPRPATIAVFRAVEWDNLGLLAVDGELLYGIVDLLLGGRRGGRPVRVEGRACTSIEAALLERLVRLVLADLAQAFAPIAPVQLRLERIETDPRFAAVTRPGNACVVVRLQVALDERGGTLAFLLPYATLEPVREILLQMFMGERLGRDTIWEQHLAREIGFAELELEAVLDERFVPLERILGLRVGSVLPLGARPDAPVVLRCGGVPMLRGRLGRVGDRVSVRIEERLGREGGD